MRKQYHYWPGDSGLDAWDVDRLISLTADFTPRRVAIESIAEVDGVYWFDDRAERPTVRKVVEHVRLIQAVSMEHPIILGADGRVMDGMHRIANALLRGDDHIDAVQFEANPKPDFRSCHPEDLPYDR